MHKGLGISIAILGLSCGLAHAQPAAGPASPKGQTPTKLTETVDKAEDVVSQPARDVGVEKIKIPPILEKATTDPYGKADVKTCKQITAEIAQLNEALGTDFDDDTPKKENRVGNLAEAGGRTVVNAFIPFRSLVREISGAAPAQRRLSDATDAGYARRGFLRGLQSERRCKPAS